MKKVLIGLLICLVFMISGCGNQLKTYEEITFDELMTKFEQKESFVLMIGSKECSHCDAFKQTLNEVIKKYQVKIYYIDIYPLKKEESNKLKSIVNYNGTPTTVFIENGEESSMYDRIDGNKPIDKVIEKLKKKGYIE